MGLTADCVSAPVDRVAAPRQLPNSGETVAAEPVIAMLTVQAEEVSVYSAAALSASVVDVVTRGERLDLLERDGGWSLVRLGHGSRGWVEAASLIPSDCTTDRPAPVIIEEPRFRFRDRGPRGVVVVEAEYCTVVFAMRQTQKLSFQP
ncbi:MAG: SH3 domain-containing protein [Acidobacteria bacterium]|nr:SH3 domain-containing protein [Acidobacteriota bacterium]